MREALHATRPGAEGGRRRRTRQPVRDVPISLGLGALQRYPETARYRSTGSRTMSCRRLVKFHLSSLYKQDVARCFLWSQGVALKDFTTYAKATTERIATNARRLVTEAGRPVISFDHVKTRNRTQH